MERESGYYWVKMRSGSWIIARYNHISECWHIPYDENAWETTDFSEIDERKIVRP